MGEHNMITALSGYGNTLDSQSIINSIKATGFTWVSVENTLLNNFTSDTESQEKVQALIEFAHENSLISIAPGISDPSYLATIWPMNVGHIHGEYIGLPNSSMSFEFSEAAF